MESYNLDGSVTSVNSNSIVPLYSCTK